MMQLRRRTFFTAVAIALAVGAALGVYSGTRAELRRPLLEAQAPVTPIPVLPVQMPPQGGTFAAIGALDLWLAMLLLAVAAILGDSVNYAIGARLGPRVFRREGVRFLNRKHLERTHEFYERYGAKTIVIARFVPIVRTFAPFVAGIGRMRYGQFLVYNVAGALLWILSLVLGGYLFGNIPMVRRNFSLVIFAIIILSILPGIIEVWRQRGRAGTTAG